MTLSLFQRELTVAVLGSGSGGNCTYIGDGVAGVLVDCGISTKQVLARLEAVGLGGAPIDAVLVTHEHIDHVGASRVLCQRLRKRSGHSVPFFMTRGTESALKDQTRPDAIETIEPNELLRVRHLQVEAFTIPHDTRDPVAYRVGAGGTWAGVITDLGKPTSLVREKMKSLSVAVLEFNHDTELLMEGSYPWALKQRIRSSHGHLSNDQASELLHDGLGESLRHLVLAHLSDENNRPAKAMAAALRALHERGAAGQATVIAALQDAPHRVAPVVVSDW